MSHSSKGCCDISGRVGGDFVVYSIFNLVAGWALLGHLEHAAVMQKQSKRMACLLQDQGQEPVKTAQAPVPSDPVSTAVDSRAGIITVETPPPTNPISLTHRGPVVSPLPFNCAICVAA